MKPHRDLKHPGNTIRPNIECLGCGEYGCITAWGDWCFKCNVERIDRIDIKLDELRKALGKYI